MIEPSLLNTAGPRFRVRLPVRPHLQPQPSRLRDHHAMLFDLRGWTVDPDLPYLVRDVLLAEAEAVAWEGQA